MSRSLVVLSASFGREDVTARVRALHAQSQLPSSLTLTPDYTTLLPRERYSRHHPYEKRVLVLVTVSTANSESVPTTPVTHIFPESNEPVTIEAAEDSVLVILSAVYGQTDVTARARQLIDRRTQSFSQLPSIDVWGDTWPGVEKTLTVTYAYVRRNGRHFVGMQNQFEKDQKPITITPYSTQHAIIPPVSSNQLGKFTAMLEGLAADTIEVETAGEGSVSWFAQ